MKFTEYIGSQFGHPRGVVGKLVCLIMNIINKHMYQGIVEEVNLQNTSRMLDIGYGNGYLVNKLYKRYRCYIEGIDISEDMRLRAFKRNKKGVEAGRIHLTVGDCCKMKYGKDTLDVVTSVNTIYFWQNTNKGFGEIYRVLKKDGVFINAVYSKEWLERLAYTKKGFKLFELEEMEQMAREVGFVKIEVKKIKHGYIIKYYK